MNRVFLNGNEITNFTNDEDTVLFVESVLSGKEPDFNYEDGKDEISFELEGQGIIDVDLSDLDENGKLTILN